MKIAHDTDYVALTIFVILFAVVTVMGFVAARWRRGDLNQLHEWGLGGRRFGTGVTWFLLGGDLYTAYTFIAVPALVFGAGAQGFFALPYTILVYPFVFVVMPRLWSVAHRNNYVTPADFVRGRFGSPGLALAVALTGILATMPYIALQLIGIQVVLEAMGVTGDWPLVLAFLILAAYTYSSGLRAPALIAIVKDLLIYLTVIVAVIYIPYKLGGFDNIFGAAKEALPTKKPAPGALVPGTIKAQTAYATLALGSALALFMYPHALTGVFAAKSANTVRRNAVLLPAYSLALGLLALIGYMTIAAKIIPQSSNFAVPDLFINFFPSWFEGLAFAAIAIGALVPAAVMSIAAANLFTRNVYTAYLRPNATDREEAQVAKLASLAVKAGALVFVIFVPTEYAIDLQLLGGVWIIQTLPAIVVGLYTRWFHRWALLAGWAVGMALGTILAARQDYKSIYLLDIGGVEINAYIAIFGVIVNLAVVIVLTPILRALKVPERPDETRPDDYDELGEAGELAPGESAPAFAGP